MSWKSENQANHWSIRIDSETAELNQKSRPARLPEKGNSR